MKRYFQVSHEAGNPYEEQPSEEGGGKRDGEEKQKPPLPPGWVDEGTKSGDGDAGDSETPGSKSETSGGGGVTLKKKSTEGVGGKGKSEKSKEVLFLEWNEHILRHKSSGRHARADIAHQEHMRQVLLATLDGIRHESKDSVGSQK